MLDGDTRRLLRGPAQEPVHLSPKAYELLWVLVEMRPRAIAKSELHEKLWPSTFVSEATLASLVAELREALGERGRDARFIRTVHGFGYAFSADAHENAFPELRRLANWIRVRRTRDVASGRRSRNSAAMPTWLSRSSPQPCRGSTRGSRLKA